MRLDLSSSTEWRHGLMVCLTAFLVLAVPRPTAAGAELSEALLFPEMFEIMASEGRNAILSDGTTPLQGRPLAGFEAEVRRIYDPVQMQTDFVTALEAELEPHPDARQDALEFATSPLGRTVIRLEISAREALLDDAIDEIARRTLDQAREAPSGTPGADRLGLVRDRIAANDLIDLNVSLGLNTTMAYYLGMMAEDPDNSMPADLLLQLVWAQEPDIRAEIEDWVETFFLMAYQPLDDSSLEAYIAYARTPLAQEFNRAMFRAFDTVFSQVSEKLGRALARQSLIEEL
ncbi:MAG: hypothetical protein ACXIU7_14645 [Roseinatronobacter sp.]